ncbi:MAG: DUF1638 domain-containing protein [Oscillospiraceae bacterium]|nr:DUF1638 domain-containing protein [Oscillospiraceae bacterium]
MYFKLIGCKIFEREIASVAYNCKNMLDVSLIKQKIHETPKKLHQLLQEEIDRIDANADNHSQDTTIVDYDAILLGYGLCAGVSMGLKSKKYPIVIPRVHDCVALFMGDKQMYKDYYFSHPGTFYSSPGFTELSYFRNDDQDERLMAKCMQRYKGNVRLAEKAFNIEKNFTAQYVRISYIDWENFDFPQFIEKNRQSAAERGWDFEVLKGSNTIFKKMVDGDWDEENFIVVPPGKAAVESYDDKIMTIDE